MKGTRGVFGGYPQLIFVTLCSVFQRICSAYFRDSSERVSGGGGSWSMLSGLPQEASEAELQGETSDFSYGCDWFSKLHVNSNAWFRIVTA